MDLSNDNNEKPRPFVEVKPTGDPTTISYNVPEPQSLNGRTFVEIAFDDNNDDDNAKIFKTSIANYVYIKGKQEPRVRTTQYDIGAIEESMKRGFDDKDLFPYVYNYAGLIHLKEVKTNARHYYYYRPLFNQEKISA